MRKDILNNDMVSVWIVTEKNTYYWDKLSAAERTVGVFLTKKSAENRVNTMIKRDDDNDDSDDEYKIREENDDMICWVNSPWYVIMRKWNIEPEPGCTVKNAT